MDLSCIKNIEVQSHVRWILSYDKKDWYEVWVSQYDNKRYHYKHPLLNEIKEALKLLDIDIVLSNNTKHRFILPE